MSAPEIINPGTASGGIPVGGSGAAGYVAKWTAPTTLGGSTTSGATASLYVDTTGQVGIGTASPGAILHTIAPSSAPEAGIFASANANSWIVFRRSTSTLLGYIGTGGLAAGGAAADMTFRSETGGLLFATGANERMRIDGTGNVGIGTASPASRLDVAGTITCDDAATGIKLPAAPGNGDSQTLDCYQENPLAATAGNGWTPTLSAAATWGGTQPNVTYARYVRMGSMVFCEVNLAVAGAMTSTYGITTMSSPFTTNANATHASVPVGSSGVYGVGFQFGTTVYLPTLGGASTYILTWSFFA